MTENAPSVLPKPKKSVALSGVAAGNTALCTVGRTGMQTSSPHLHLELLGPEGLFDGAQILRGHVIGTPVELEPPKKKRKS